MRMLCLAVALAAALASIPAEAQTAAQPSTGTPASSQAANPSATAKASLVDINTASQPELEALPGIGPARAAIIIKGRPYNGKDELRRKKLLPEKVYQGIRELIVARQS